MKLRLLLTFTLAVSFCVAAQSQERRKKRADNPPQLEGAKVEVYKKIGDVELNIYIYNPVDQKPTDKRPVAVLFFGGGWTSGTPAQFEQQCKYLASRGMVAMTADYRVLSRHGTKAKECVADAKSAIRWVRQEAERLGVDPNRVVAGGGSAGGHIAACTGVIDGFDESTDDLSISSKPNA
ncbi:MAG: alpha/beta hydrolase [Planctomycetota bacterium]